MVYCKGEAMAAVEATDENGTEPSDATPGERALRFDVSSWEGRSVEGGLVLVVDEGGGGSSSRPPKKDHNRRSCALEINSYDAHGAIFP